MSQQFESSNSESEWTVVFHSASEQASKLYFSLESAGHQVFFSPAPIKRCDYNSYILVYTSCGHDCLYYGGKSYPLTKGDFFFIDGNKLHEYGFSGQWEYYWIDFKGQNTEMFYQQFRKMAGSVVAKLPYATEFIGMVNHIVEIKEHEDINFDPQMSVMIYKTLVDLMILLKQIKGVSGKRGIDEAITYMHENYQEDISLDDIAAHVYMDKYHLVRVFKATTEYTPYEYLLNLRIEKAKPYLLYTDIRVEDIAHKVGFSNASSFISAFKRREAKTPLKYRSTGD